MLVLHWLRGGITEVDDGEAAVSQAYLAILSVKTPNPLPSGPR